MEAIYPARSREKWGEITDDDLEPPQQSRSTLSGLVRSANGIAREEAEKAVDSWSRENWAGSGHLLAPAGPLYAGPIAQSRRLPKSNS